MKFSVRWLRKYLDADLTLDQLLDALTMCGLEVEEVLDLGMVSGNVVVGEILKINPIEGADKIRLIDVMADSKEPLRIVCGAWNLEEGQRVPVAKFGMTFPDGFVLKRRKIMGIDGDGMLCSAKELGVAEDAAGIWILPEDAPVAEPWDAIVEINITPNRPDALSLVGVARDVAAKVGGKFRQPQIQLTETGERTETAARVTVEAKEGCPRYAARVIKGITVGPSPQWMQAALESAGMRPINNIVDITNYVMLELGQPLHAFDLDLVAGHHIVVRNAAKGETLTTLDGVERKLETDDLLICDGEKPVAIAGVMGGGNSEVNDETKDILLESAWFNPATVRRTRTRLDMSTEASYRFERGADPKIQAIALSRAAQLMADHAGGAVMKGHIDVVGSLPVVDPITVRVKRLREALGIELSGRQVVDVLTPLGFEILRSDGEEMLVEPPSHRPDVSIEADIVEEVARIIGYEKIPERQLVMPSIRKPVDPVHEASELFAEVAISHGLNQAINFSFTSEGANAVVGAADGRQIRVLNPIVADQSVMRRSLMPSLLQNVAHNLSRGVEDIRLFEVGRTYEFNSDEPEEQEPRDMTPVANERRVFAAILCGGTKENWREKPHSHDFYEAKGLVEQLLRARKLNKIVFEAAEDVAWLHPGRAARCLIKGKPVAAFGEVHPAILHELDIKKRVYYVEIPLEGAVLDGGASSTYTELPRFPAMTRDIALVVDSTVPSLELERTIKKSGRDLLAGVKLFDVYEGEHVEKGKKSLAFSLTYRRADRTLTDEEVSERHGDVVAQLEKNHGAKLRG